MTAQPGPCETTDVVRVVTVFSIVGAAGAAVVVGFTGLLDASSFSPLSLAMIPCGAGAAALAGYLLGRPFCTAPPSRSIGASALVGVLVGVSIVALAYFLFALVYGTLFTVATREPAATVLLYLRLGAALSSILLLPLGAATGLLLALAASDRSRARPVDPPPPLEDL
ncbi:hypothetical protein [Rubrivirga sp. IMCC43871]|uniref:hypothetical protein n=1 Tax=Rubrivirga sp. IMCC43871 TaxID=3391575 RepID=UPI00398F91D8